MKRRLRTSEIILLLLTFVVIFGGGNIILYKKHKAKVDGAAKRIAELEEEIATHDVYLADQEYWAKKSQWLDEHMPVMGDFGELQSKLLDDLRETAAQRNITFEQQALDKPQGGSAFHQEVSVTVLVEGPDQAIYRWLADLQSPEKFQAIKFMQLYNDTGGSTEPQMDCKLTLARWFRP